MFSKLKHLNNHYRIEPVDIENVKRSAREEFVSLYVDDLFPIRLHILKGEPFRYIFLFNLLICLHTNFESALFVAVLPLKRENDISW